MKADVDSTMHCKCKLLYIITFQQPTARVFIVALLASLMMGVLSGRSRMFDLFRSGIQDACLPLLRNCFDLLAKHIPNRPKMNSKKCQEVSDKCVDM